MTVASTAPLPDIADLLALLSGASDDGGDIALPWRREGDDAFWFSRAAWGLAAVVEGCGSARGRPPALWLPDYFCNQPTGPARRRGARLVFYPVTDALEPDWAACRRLAEAGPPDLFLQVHYFGRAAGLAPARAFCGDFGAALIEDAAHVLAPTGDIGEGGDYVLYSPYKHLPVPDAGLLLVRPGARQADAVRAAAATGGMAPGAAGWIAKRLVQRAAPGFARLFRRTARSAFADDPPAAELPATPALGGAARRLLRRQTARIAEIAAARRANERALRDALSGVGGLAPLFPPPKNDEAPYRAVFRAANPSRAAELFDHLQQGGSVVESWPDLAPEVRAAPERHGVALALRATVLALPVHASWTPAELTASYRPPG